MNKQVDEEFKYIHDEYLLQCICTEIKDKIIILKKENQKLKKENQKLKKEIDFFKNCIIYFIYKLVIKDK